MRLRHAPGRSGVEQRDRLVHPFPKYTSEEQLCVYLLT